jgi:hypothetical protein
VRVADEAGTVFLRSKSNLAERVESAEFPPEDGPALRPMMGVNEGVELSEIEGRAMTRAWRRSGKGRQAGRTSRMSATGMCNGGRHANDVNSIAERIV